MGLDMYLYSAPKIKSLEELEIIETRLAEAFFVGEGKLEIELKKIQKEKKFKKPIHYKINEYPKTKSDYEKFKLIEHVVKVDVCKEIGYWRKFNALHSWFVDTLQHGVECTETIINIKTLEKLLYNIAKINKENPQDILPTKAGFSFGNTEYDENYWWRIERLKMYLMNLFEENDFKENVLIYSSC